MASDDQLIYDTITKVYGRLTIEYGEGPIRQYIELAKNTRGQPTTQVAEGTDVDVVTLVKDVALAISAWITLIKLVPLPKRNEKHILEITKDWPTPRRHELIKALLDQMRNEP